MHRTFLRSSVGALLLSLTPLLLTAATGSADATERARPALAPTTHSAAGAADRARRGRLKVSVVKPARGAAARVTVRGPRGFQQVLRRTTVLRGLPPGRYRINAARVVRKTWYSPPTVTPRRVRVRAGRAARAEVSYWTTVSRDVRVLTAGAIRGYTAPDPSAGAARGSIVLARRFPVGHVLAAGVTPATPYGALVKVVAVDRTDGGWLHTVVLGRLQDAVPRGELDVSFTAATNRGIQPPAAFRGEAPPTPLAARRAACTGAVKAGVDLDADASFAPVLQARWNWTKSSVTVGVAADAWVYASAWAEANGSCTTGDVAIWGQPLAVIAFAIGPIPVVLVPRIDISAGADLSATGKVRATGLAGATGSASTTVRLGAPTFQASGPGFDGWGRVTGYANASANAYGKARLSMLLYGLAGPYAEVRAGLEARVNSAVSPWWTFDGAATAGMGVRIGGCVDLWFDDFCLKLEAGKPDILNGRARLAQATTPFPVAGSVIGALEGSRVVFALPPERIGALLAQGPAKAFSPDRDDWHVSTGLVRDVAGPVGELASTAHGTPGDQLLSSLLDRTTYDAAGLRMRLTPEGNRLVIPYVFGTEEPPGSAEDGLAIVVGGQSCGTPTGGAVRSADATISNLGQALPTRFDRVTPVRQCVVPVTPGQPVDVLLVVGDTGDRLRDSAVAVVGDRITSYTAPTGPN
jgi:hypothetical protein